MKIAQVTEDAIIFDNGNKITFDHCQDCCEWNYADFSVLTPDVIGYDHDFDPNLKFKWDGQGGNTSAGFVFGDKEQKIFIPCYSEQNGYYTNELEIYYNDKLVAEGDCEEIYV